TDKTPEKFIALGGFIDRLNGSYKAAEDVGTTTDDAELVATRTAHITGLPVSRGGSGDPSPMTAWGVVCAIRAALAEAGGGDADLRGGHAAARGRGHVGADVARPLPDAGARVTVADIYADRVEPLVAQGAEEAPADRVHAVECNVFSPCALGAVINGDTI